MRPLIVGWVERNDTHLCSIKSRAFVRLRRAGNFQVQGFHSTASIELLLFACPKRSNQEKCTPGAAPRALRARGSLRLRGIQDQKTDQDQYSARAALLVCMKNPMHPCFENTVHGWTNSWITGAVAVPSIAGGAGKARRVAARDRRDCEAVHGRTV